MPTIGAMVLASVLALLAEGWIRPYVGLRIKAALALLVWFAVFYFARKWLMGLRGE